MEKRTRKPTEIEQHFIDGFEATYDEKYDITSGHAVALNKLVSRHKVWKVKEKIDAWWTADLNVKGQRDLGAFIRWFSSIMTRTQIPTDPLHPNHRKAMREANR